MSASIRLASTLLAPLLMWLAFGARPASAVCPPGASDLRYVGDTATDTQCTDNDIQSAINNTQCPNSLIVITPEHTYAAQHLDLNGKSVTLKGTLNGCGLFFEPPPPTSPVIAISGSGHSGDSVLYIHGNSNVTLQYLSIEAGNNLGGYGGGIHFDGTGALVLDTTWVRNNMASDGGGINFNGAGGFAGLTVLGYTQILHNTAANSGGGIQLTGQSFMSILSDNTLVSHNHAPDGYGGGIHIVGPAHADIASPGLGTLGVVYSNDAKYGGGIAVIAGSSTDEDTHVQLYTIDPARPVHIQDNFASSSGGGIYLKPYVGFPAFNLATVCAFDFRIDNNGAPEGSAMHLAYDSDFIDSFGSFAFLNVTNSRCAGLPSAARRCSTGIPCNELSGNQSIDVGGNATLGAAILVDGFSTLSGDRFAMGSNVGGYAIRSTNYMQISNCLLASNNVSRQLLQSSSGDIKISNCTLANNSILSTDTIHAEGPLELVNSIINQPGNLALAYSGNPADLHVAYVLSSDVSTLPPVEGVALGQPTFVNAALGDYHLQLNSLGIDYAPPIAGDDRDLDNFPHDQDLPPGNLWGVRDLGAYERQLACTHGDTIFCDSFDGS